VKHLLRSLDVKEYLGNYRVGRFRLALSMLLMTVLDCANVERLVTQVDPENVASAKIIQKISWRKVKGW